MACIDVGGTVVGWIDVDASQPWLHPGEGNVGYCVFRPSGEWLWDAGCPAPTGDPGGTTVALGLARDRHRERRIAGRRPSIRCSAASRANHSTVPTSVVYGIELSGG
jgi:hypothetical protein